MNIGSKIRKINTKSTVFTTGDIRKALNIHNDKSLYNAISYAVNKQEFSKISDGIYSFDKNYSKKEYANNASPCTLVCIQYYKNLEWFSNHIPQYI